MFRFVLLTSLGVIVAQPAFAQQTAPTPAQPAPAQMTSGPKPASSIALSSFALAQRDEVRDRIQQIHPNLQASAPVVSGLSVKAPPTLPVAQPSPLPARQLVGARPVQQPTATPVLTIAAPVTTNIPTTQTSPKLGDASGEATSPSPNLSAQPKILASREAIRQRMLLSRLDADLAAAQPKLNRAQARLTESQRQLGAFTTSLRSAMLEAGDEGSGLHPFVRVAQRYLGTPYVWGGESARGFDCSGFIMRVMRDLGYRALPHSAAEQFHYGTPIARELLKPGDVVFFANTYKPGVSHVGIYLGRGRFIHAANSKVGTIVSSLNEAKWVQHYAGARRLVRGGS